MGLGFVLLLAGVVGVGAATVFGVIGWLAHRRATLSRRLAAALAPAGVLAFAGIMFIGYAFWCDARQVDVGIGDSAQVPLNNGYFFCIVDTTSYLLRGGCSGSPAVEGLVQLAEVGDRIVGITARQGAFVLDTRTDELWRFTTGADALKEFSPAPTLQSEYYFFNSRRWGWPDVVIAAASGIPFAIVALWWCLSIYRQIRWRPSESPLD